MKYTSAAAFRQALDQRLKNEAARTVPTSLPAAPAIWADPYRRLADTVNVEPDLPVAVARAAAFLDPVLAGHAGGRWSTRRSEWAAASE